MQTPAPRLSFSGHETFPFRYTWLHKAVERTGKHPDAFSAEDAMVYFGVGKNMVSAIRHWALATGMLEEDVAVPHSRGRMLKVTVLGEKLFGKTGWDPYLEDPGTLWLLHWQLATNGERATTWAWVFGHLPRPEFSRTELLAWLVSFAEQHGGTRISEGTVARDVDCFIRTYVASRPSRKLSVEETVDCPLADLALIREFGSRGHFFLARRDQPSLPDAVFAFAAASYVTGLGLSSGTLPLDRLAFAAGSPGRVFALSEDALLRRLGRLNALTNGALALDETAGLRQVLVRSAPDPVKILDDYYDRAWAQPAAVAGGRR